MKRLFLVVFLLSLITSTFASQNVASSQISFEDRVFYQQRIENVYWQHTIWPPDNPKPKPLLEAVMSQSIVRSKVEEYLRKSEALASYWERPINADQLQQEIDRMEQETADPDLLRELWQALNNSPFLIAECLARPLVADRLISQTEGFDDWWEKNHHAVSILTEVPAKQYRVAPSKDATDFKRIARRPAGDSWKATQTTGAPTPRNEHSQVWTGTQMIVWGGWDGVCYKTGGRYTPATNSWTATTTNGAPTARAGHSGIWTGTELIVWGGFTCDGKVLKTGGRYNPLTDSWVDTPTTGAPDPRYRHSAIWTGKQMIIWGGGGRRDRSVLKTGGRYSPSDNSWKPTNTNGAPPPRAVHTVVWTGTEMIVWGGIKFLSVGSVTLNTGGRYKPATNSWSPVTTKGAPYKRTNHTAVWAGTQMIVWGGSSDTTVTDGGRYNPTTNSWSNVSTIGAPSPRYGHTAVWTGTQMIVWGGSFGPSFRTGGRYIPATDKWAATTLTGAPAARSSHEAVWTGTQMIVWGGLANFTKDLKTGGRYIP